MTKLGLLTAAALIALSPLAMAQSSDPAIPQAGSFLVAQAQDEAQAPAPMQEQSASEAEQEDKSSWSEENGQVPKDSEE
ncbi:MAG: hypothetical protein KGI46_09640 [Alphaproteobacteria bacterium]|nr:hypothetical protein [Alphaproteobacteria bacterium]MDE1931862.1 hypothetical protein [Alphaproteobacteria bacterium]